MKISTGGRQFGIAPCLRKNPVDVCRAPPDARQGLLILRVMNAKKALKVLNS